MKKKIQNGYNQLFLGITKGKLSFRSFLSDNRGAVAVEYALVTVVIAVAIVAAATLMPDQLKAFFQSVVDIITGFLGAKKPTY